MRKSIKRNFFYNAIYQILLLIIPLITTPYLSRVLGADGIGTISYAESMLNYFVLFANLGITTYGQREISYVQNKRKQRSIIFWNTKCLQFVTSAIAFVAFVAFSWQQKNRSLYFALSLQIVAIFFDITWLFQGMEEFGKIVLRNTIVKILNIIFVFTFVKSQNDLVLYAIGLTGFVLLGNFSLWGYLSNYIDKIDIKELHPFREINVVISLFLPTIAIQVYTVLDKTMIGVITHNSYENGYYEQAFKISRVALALVTSLGSVMMPRIAFYLDKDFEYVRSTLYKAYRFVWMLSIPLTLGIVGVAPNLVPWFFGEGYEPVVQLLRILSMLIIAIGVSNITGIQYLIPSKRQHLLTVSVCIGAAVNFCMNMILIPYIQAIGAAIASVCAESIIAVVQLIMVRKELSIRKIVLSGKNYLLAGLIMLSLLLLESRFLTPSIMHTAIMTVSGAVLYCAILLLFRDDFFLGNLSLMLGKIRRKTND